MAASIRPWLIGPNSNHHWARPYYWRVPSNSHQRHWNCTPLLSHLGNTGLPYRLPHIDNQLNFRIDTSFCLLLEHRWFTHVEPSNWKIDLDILKRFMWNVNRSGGRHRFIFCPPSRITALRGHTQLSDIGNFILCKISSDNIRDRFLNYPFSSSQYWYWCHHSWWMRRIRVILLVVQHT